MPVGALKRVQVKQPKPLVVSWDTWKKGWNTLLRETEIAPQEMVTSTNLMLVGSGIPTRRWGSVVSFQAGASNASLSGVARFVLPIKDANNNQQVLSWTDAGYLTKQSGMSYTTISGASWLSGYPMEGVQLGGKIYLMNGQRPFTYYNFTTLTSFLTLASPSALTATNLSGATGSNIFSWKVTALSPVGETLPSTAVSLSTLPLALNTTVRLNWGAVSPGAGASLIGYNVYRGLAGQETWIGGVGPTVTTFDDNVGYPFAGGSNVPLADTTGGPVAKWIIRFQDRLVIAGIPGYPTRVMVSGKWPQQERFDLLGDGTFVDIEPDSGEYITGIGIYYRSNDATQTIVVFKEHSVWEVTLASVTAGNYAFTDANYRLLTASQGAASHRSIQAVENDIYFANERGIYILRQEPNLFNVINANELSAKIRPFFQNLSFADITNAAAFYADKKYVLSFPYSQQAICFDRERLAFTGPWQFPWNLNHWAKYTDSSGNYHWLAASNSDNKVYEFSNTLTNDNGTAISTQFKSRKEDFSDWTLFKTITEVFVNFRNIIGSIQLNLYVETRAGTVISAKTATIAGAATQGTSGLGIDQIGTIQMGLSSGTPATTGTGEIQKKALLYQTGRTIQMEIVTTSPNANYELLNAKLIAIAQSRDNNPTGWNL